MAELALSAAALTMATPGIAIAFVGYARYLSERLSAFKNAPENIHELQVFLQDLHEGTLKTNIELAEWAFGVDDLDPGLKKSLESHLKTLQVELLAAKESFDELFHDDGSLRKRVRYLEFFGLTKVRKVMQNLNEWQSVFQGAIHLAYMKRMVVPDNMLLTSSKFKPFLIASDDKKYCTRLGPASHIWLGDAEAIDEVPGRVRSIRKISFLMERKHIDQHEDISEAKELASYLARRLAANPSHRGILKCLGFREANNHLELVFEIPSELEPRPKTLRDVIVDDYSRKGAGYGGSRPLDHRFRLARQISEAVLSVHTAQLVHKNIRTETILVFPARGSSNDVATTSTSPGELGNPFLTDWKTVRKTDDLSARKGSNDWTADIYRHPQRQGLQPEERYTMHHDIYSLGVCLLEIGLWEPFIVTDPQKQQVLWGRYHEVALSSGLVTENEARSLSKLTKPRTVQKVMMELARTQLPQRMGLAFTELVLYCFNCVEEKSGCSTEESSGIAMKFNDRILQAFMKVPIPS